MAETEPKKNIFKTKEFKEAIIFVLIVVIVLFGIFSFLSVNKMNKEMELHKSAIIKNAENIKNIADFLKQATNQQNE